ncbi:MAG: hypothetical protein H6602_02385 [Flavobacteriales bacterium]|nr:hypothetical protein [Flavobacteriales bacterium]
MPFLKSFFELESIEKRSVKLFWHSNWNGDIGAIVNPTHHGTKTTIITETAAAFIATADTAYEVTSGANHCLGGAH